MGLQLFVRRRRWQSTTHQCDHQHPIRSRCFPNVQTKSHPETNKAKRKDAKRKCIRSQNRPLIFSHGVQLAMPMVSLIAKPDNQRRQEILRTVKKKTQAPYLISLSHSPITQKMKTPPNVISHGLAKNPSQSTGARHFPPAAYQSTCDAGSDFPNSRSITLNKVAS